MVKIDIAKDFTQLPGGRFRTDGDNSGEEFYENILKIKFENLKDNEKLEINLDGTFGYPSSFISEAFGRLYKNHGGESIFDKLELVSDEDSMLIDFIHDLARKYV